MNFYPAPILETERLILRPLTVEDAEAAFAWTSDVRVNRFLSYTPHKSINDTADWILNIIPVANEFVWGVMLKESGLLIGSCGIGPKQNKTGAWEFGYCNRFDCWGKGYATEVTQRMIEFAYRQHNIKDFAAVHAVDNPASGKVMEKCGLKFDCFCEYQKRDGSETFPAKRYTMHKD